VPEIAKIQRAYDQYKSAGGSLVCRILPFHGSLTRLELDNVQEAARRQIRKFSTRLIIAATNIAESSITLENLTLVLDFGLVKYPVYNEPTGCTGLPMNWADKSMFVQRKGRVGRVCDGGVLRMFPQSFYYVCLESEVPPEISRMRLEGLVMTLIKISTRPMFLVNKTSRPST
jgi:ATP-dependent helicase HrpB